MFKAFYNLDKDEKGALTIILTSTILTAIFSSRIYSFELPIGMDTFSHLPKVAYISKFGPSFWCYDWYCGYPIFTSYAPLSYLLVYPLTLIGLDAIFSYKLVEVLFLLVAPLCFYKFCRAYSLERRKAFYATMIFSIFPSVIHNPLIFGRFPNIVSFPFFILTLMFTFKATENFSKKYFLLASILFTLTLLTHHFSAYILSLVFLIYALSLIFEIKNVGLKTLLTKMLILIGILFLSFIFSAFWLLLYIVDLTYWVSFYTQNVNPLISAALLILLTALTIICLKSFASYTSVKSLFTLAWAFLFLVFSSYFFPLTYFLPFGGSIDFMRFQLYLSIPFSLLIAGGRSRFLKTKGKSESLKDIKLVVVFLLILNIIIFFAVFQFFGETVREEVFCESIPEPVILYLKNNKEYGRILTFKCPFSVYLLPSQTGKPLVDGWYPQGSVLPIIKFNVKKTLTRIEDESLISTFIKKSQVFGVKWVLLGDPGKAYLLQNSSFKKVLNFSRYILYENTLNISYVETNPKTELKWSQTRDMIRIIVEVNSRERLNVTVREAYFPGWTGWDNSEWLNISPTKNGFISFELKGVGKHNVTLTFNPYHNFFQRLIKNLEL